MMTLYNEIDPFAASWLEQLIAHDHIAQGTVQRRSIVDLSPADVAGPGQRHFFAGIGGWSYALRRSGVSDDASIWTGSCPCQPFSDAGKGGGASDPSTSLASMVLTHPRVSPSSALWRAGCEPRRPRLARPCFR